MGLKSTIAAAVTTAYTTLGTEANDGLLSSIDYNQITVGTYNPLTDALSNTVVTTTLNVVISTIKTTEQDWTIVIRDSKKIIINAGDISFVPSTDDSVTIDGEDWDIIKVNRVPGDSIYILFVRFPDGG